MWEVISRDKTSTKPTSDPDHDDPGELPSPDPVVATTRKAIVAAIDVGTTYSGYAYADREEFKINDHRTINLNKWSANNVLRQWDKAPSVVMFEPDGKFHSFGYKAESEYMKRVKAGDYNKWYCFRRFKMQLYNEKVS